MGTIWDLTKRSSFDYVDNPYWSIFQIKTRNLKSCLNPEEKLQDKAIGDEDLGKVKNAMLNFRSS
jgi:hypothetical protein